MNNLISSASFFMAILVVVITMLTEASAQEGGIGGMLDGAMKTASQMTGGMM